MKNKLLLIVAFSLGMQSNISFASEPSTQSWGDWFRSKFAATRQAVAEKAPSVGATTAGVMATAGYLEPALRSILPRNYLLLAGSFGLIYSTLGLAIDAYISRYQQGSDSKTVTINNIKNDLTIAIANPLLYPTRSSKLHALLKKDEFLQYINDQDGLVEQACNQVIKEINAMPYSNTQKELDKIIDDKMAEARVIIAHGNTLQAKIKLLEDYCKEPLSTFDFPEMQAYLSVYFRLKNKQDVESKLSPEEKASRQTERSELQKAREFLKMRSVD
jgi:hypothetical protein